MRLSQLHRGTGGFTLLEVLIAMTILTMTLTSILSVQSSAIDASTRAKEMNVVAMLAKNQMIETEFMIEGKEFKDVNTEDSGQFAEPFQDYSWTRKVKELKFPALGFGGGGDDDSGGGDAVEMLSKLFAKFLSDAIREVDVSIQWKQGASVRTFTVSTYWVNFEQEFSLSE